MRSFTIKNKSIKYILIAIAWIALWQMIYMAVNKDILLPSPCFVFFRLIELMGTKTFWLATIHTVGSIAIGFMLAVIIGVALAVLTHCVPLAYDFFYPAISIIKATPVASFIILLLVWLRTDSIPIFTSFLMVVPVVWSNISVGIKEVDKDLLNMAKAYDFSKNKTILHVYIPSVIPYFVSAVTLGVGMAWKAGVAAEVITLPKPSMGSQLYYSKIYIEIVDLFAWTVAIIILSMLIEKIVIKAIKKLANGRVRVL